MRALAEMFFSAQQFRPGYLLSKLQFAAAVRQCVHCILYPSYGEHEVLDAYVVRLCGIAMDVHALVVYSSHFHAAIFPNCLKFLWCTGGQR